MKISTISLRAIVVISCFLSTLFTTISAVPITPPDSLQESAAAHPPYGAPLRLYGHNQVAGHSSAISPPSQTIVPQDIQPTFSGCNGLVKKLISAFVDFFHNHFSPDYNDGPITMSLVSKFTSRPPVDPDDPFITPIALYIGLSIAQIRRFTENTALIRELHPEVLARSLNERIEQARATLLKHPDPSGPLKELREVLDKVMKWYKEIYVDHSRTYGDLGAYLGLDSLPKNEEKPRTPTTAGIAGSANPSEHGAHQYQQ